MSDDFGLSADFLRCVVTGDTAGLWRLMEQDLAELVADLDASIADGEVSTEEAMELTAVVMTARDLMDRSKAGQRIPQAEILGLLDAAQRFAP